MKMEKRGRPQRIGSYAQTVKATTISLRRDQHDFLEYLVDRNLVVSKAEFFRLAFDFYRNEINKTMDQTIAELDAKLQRVRELQEIEMEKRLPRLKAKA